MTRLFVLGDLHGSWKMVRKLRDTIVVEKPDLVLVCGDITHFGSTDEAKNLLLKLSVVKPLLFVPGNCDPPTLLTLESINDAKNIHLKAFVYDDILFFGLGGCPFTPFHTLIEWDDTQMRSLLHDAISTMIKKLSYSLFVFCSHTPPIHTKLDVIFTGEHVGSMAVREAISYFKPNIGIHAHIHEAMGYDNLGRTLLLNAGPAARGHYAIVEVDNAHNVSFKFKKSLK